MKWLRKLSQDEGNPSLSDTQFWGHKYRRDNPDFEPQFNVFQSSDFPHVFLGGQDD